MSTGSVHVHVRYWANLVLFMIQTIVQLDLGYPATSYPDISIIRLWSCSLYCLFFIHFPHKILLKTKTIKVCFISFYMYSSTSLIRPPFIRISLLSGRDLAVIFFVCVCTIITGKRRISNSIRIPTQTHMNYILFPT